MNTPDLFLSTPFAPVWAIITIRFFKKNTALNVGYVGVCVWGTPPAALCARCETRDRTSQQLRAYAPTPDAGASPRNAPNLDRPQSQSVPTGSNSTKRCVTARAPQGRHILNVGKPTDKKNPDRGDPGFEQSCRNLMNGADKSRQRGNRRHRQIRSHSDGERR